MHGGSEVEHIGLAMYSSSGNSDEMKERKNKNQILQRKWKNFSQTSRTQKCYESLGGSNILDGICYAILYFHSICHCDIPRIHITYVCLHLLLCWIFYMLLYKKYRYVMLVQESCRKVSESEIEPCE